MKLAHTPGDAAIENEVAATCKVEGSYDEVIRCTECGEEISRETKPTVKLAHTPGDAAIENEVAATCKVEGSYDEVIRCTECGEVISHRGMTSEKLPHVAGEWFVDNAATCKEEGSKHQECAICHDPIATDTIQIDASNHADYGTHVEGQMAATCAVDGYTGDSICSGCGKKLADGQAIPKETAVHTLTHVDAKPATTEAEGNVAYYHCSVCGKNFSDQNGTQQLTKVTTDKLPKQDEPQKNYNDCKYCGEKHTGPFGWLIKIIHSILAVFGLRK